MAKQELIAALRNALERGESVQEAKISLLNAGYLRQDVEQAAMELDKIKIKREVPKPKFLPKLNSLPEAPKRK